MFVQNTPLAASYNSYSLMAAAAAAAQSSGQVPGSHPVGSLEALRATWHAPRLPGQEAWQPGSLGAQPGQQQQGSHGLYGPGPQQSYLPSLQQFQPEQSRCVHPHEQPCAVCGMNICYMKTTLRPSHRPLTASALNQGSLACS